MTTDNATVSAGLVSAWTLDDANKVTLFSVDEWTAHFIETSKLSIPALLGIEPDEADPLRVALFCALADVEVTYTRIQQHGESHRKRSDEARWRRQDGGRRKRPLGPHAEPPAPDARQLAELSDSLFVLAEIVSGFVEREALLAGTVEEELAEVVGSITTPQATTEVVEFIVAMRQYRMRFAGRFSR